jgi:dihydrofolate synthase/folylpolyglutamate synthase
MTALGFWYFVQENVDIAVVEVGLGGRLDSTNVLTPVLSVITNIGLDHTEFLGNTLTQIAKEKAGIIKPGVPVVIGESHPQTMNVFLAKAQECGSDIWFADQCEYLRRTRLKVAPECELKGNYQEHNLQTAFVALRALTNLQYPISNVQIAEGFAHVCTMTGLRGRWEILREQPLVICDTGHNSHGLQYVARQLKELTNPHIWIVFGMVNDKDTEVVMRLMPSGERYHYIFTRPNTQRARTAQEMLAIWGKEGIAIEEPQEAIHYALEHAAPEDAVFIGGSNYLVAEVLQ